jgi:TonB family protein
MESRRLNSRAARKVIICSGFTAGLLLSGPLKAQSAAHSPVEPKSSAVDAKGVRHQITEYGEGRAPWDTDRMKFVRPDYPSDLRARHIEGTGPFRITLDVNTGSVTNVTVLKSTGFPAFDGSAIRAIRQWRWRPRRWKEIDMPVTFTMSPREHYGSSTLELLAKAAALNRKGDHDKAIVLLSEAIQQQSTFTEAYISRGAAYQSKGDYDRALADFNRAIQLDPKSARAYCDRAILKDEILRQPEEALADYNQAIHLAPGLGGLYLTEVHISGGEATTSARSSISLGPLNSCRTT